MASSATSPDATREDPCDSPDVEFAPSPAGTDEADSDSMACQWTTSRFHDQECAHYFDCPSHTVERRVPSDQPEEQAESPPLVFPTEELPYDLYGDGDNSSHNSPSEASQPDITAVTESPAGETSLGDTMASPGSPELAPMTTPLPHKPRDSEAIEQREGSQSSFSFPQRQASVASSFDPHSDMERDDETPNLASGPLPGPSQPSTAQNQTSSPSASPGGYPARRHSAQVSPQGIPRQPQPRPQEGTSRRPSDFVLPRWQPDAEVTYCPICQTQFSFFVRKHHCRKCGRVVCNSCSPHRIIIPYQYIVRPPGSEIPVPQSLLLDSLGVGYMDVNGMSGGERVRLCNPCVPDPNTAPPQSSTASTTTPSSISPRSSHQRSRSSIGNAYGAATASNRYGVVFASGQSHDPFQAYAPRNRSLTVNPAGHAIPGPSSSRPRGYPSAMGRYPAMGSSGTSVPSYPGYPGRHSSLRNSPSSSRHRVLPPTPQIAEEDECPICHRELPQRNLPNFEALRESHITSCIESHSRYGSPRPTGGGEDQQPPPPPRQTGMYTYPATEKDCIDDAECTICLEEFTVGVPMARLECLCRFHRSCISAWFVNHPGRCPVHQHDGFGY